MFNITPLNTEFDKQIQQVIDQKTKPIGALGALEPLAFQLAKIQLTQYFSDVKNKKEAFNFTDFKFDIRLPQLMVFAGDHGVAKQGVSIAPSEVTSQMLENFAQGGAAINVFCSQLGWQLSVIDAGTLLGSSHEKVIDQRLGNITHAINQQAAMTIEQVGKGFLLAKKLVDEKVDNGCNAIAFGEMGIGNTTSASAIYSVLLNLSPTETVGPGTGIDQDTQAHKAQLIEKAISLHSPNINTSLGILQCLGGFEIAALVGAYIKAAQLGIPILVDGFICTAAALVACKINPDARNWMLFSHQSGEPAHGFALDYLSARPLLNLNMRLGEGSGAAIAASTIKNALNLHANMATFTDAGVSDKDD